MKLWDAMVARPTMHAAATPDDPDGMRSVGWRWLAAGVAVMLASDLAALVAGCAIGLGPLDDLLPAPAASLGHALWAGVVSGSTVGLVVLVAASVRALRRSRRRRGPGRAPGRES